MRPLPPVEPLLNELAFGMLEAGGIEPIEPEDVLREGLLKVVAFGTLCTEGTEPVEAVP